MRFNLPKYTVCKVSRHSGVFWSVNAGRKELALFATQSEAHDYVQRLVQDDAWNAANRD
jgi:hypothetical protein